jgi:hypothetical protein
MYNCDSEYDEDDQSPESFFYSHAQKLKHNRGYDGSRCFCKPCVGCYGEWIPADCFFGAMCTDCKPSFGEDLRWEFDQRTAPDSTSDMCEFLARNAQAHWRLVRWCVRVRPWALHWLSACTERVYDPARLNMADELASATRPL